MCLHIQKRCMYDVYVFGLKRSVYAQSQIRHPAAGSKEVWSLEPCSNKESGKLELSLCILLARIRTKRRAQRFAKGQRVPGEDDGVHVRVHTGPSAIAPRI